MRWLLVLALFGPFMSVAAKPELFHSNYVYEIPKYSPEAVHSKHVRKSVREQMEDSGCKNVIVGNPISTSQAEGHPAQNFQQTKVSSSNCILLRKPRECPGLWKSRWLFKDQTTDKDWVLCRKN